MSRTTFIASITGQSPRLPSLVELIAREHGVRASELSGYSRIAEVVKARHSYWAALHDMGIPISEIARRVGRDWSTVRHGISQHKGGE